VAHALWRLLASLWATGAAVASVSAVADPGERVLGAAEWPEPLVVVATCPILDASAVVAEWAAGPVDSGPVTVPVVIRPELAAGTHRDLYFLVGLFHDTGAGIRCSRPTAWPGYAEDWDCQGCRRRRCGPGCRGRACRAFHRLEAAYRAKSTTAALRSTFVVRLPAPIHADACTWLPDRSFAHQGR
jgi:hypothetical protein